MKILVLVQPKIYNLQFQMSVIMLNKNISNNSMKETGTSCEGLLPTSRVMQGQSWATVQTMKTM